MNIELKQKFDLLIPTETIQLIKKFEELKARMKIVEEQIKEEGYTFLLENDLLEEGYEQDGIKLTYYKPSQRTLIDKEKMKEDGVYEKYSYKKEYDGYAKVTVKYEDE